ncbi:hypothetical protein B0H17DRAFT_1036876 [Mycena rosella]|uniref:Homeobox domain-containing protein n=1 Tax=Mycena rosella TaxID=1033263 RepID=A0AAD7GVV8_MYCRO|nr:hypothetical protein B0H17DRAFT_1036876 [Mycena rosella]
MASSLDVLADAAVQRASSPACYDSHDFDHTPPHSPTSSTTSACPSNASKRSNAATGIAACHQLRPRKKAHKSHKSSRLHIKPKPELKIRRKELMDRACGIKSLENSPVNEQQLFVLRTVYDEITMYPTEPWLVLIAVVLHRSLRQVKNWFSNTRQKNRWGDVVCTRTDVGERLRLRPSAIELCDQWSDAFFEEVLMIINYRTARRLQFERAQAMNKFTLTNIDDLAPIS